MEEAAQRVHNVSKPVPKWLPSHLSGWATTRGYEMRYTTCRTWLQGAPLQGLLTKCDMWQHCVTSWVSSVSCARQGQYCTPSCNPHGSRMCRTGWQCQRILHNMWIAHGGVHPCCTAMQCHPEVVHVSSRHLKPADRHHFETAYPVCLIPYLVTCVGAAVGKGKGKT